jgi:hypothetical protein
MQMWIRIECNLEQEFGQMTEPVYEYRAAKTRCRLDSRIYGKSVGTENKISAK